jgi:glycosyltransferase involved in cell wall biosynthesis
MTTTVSVVIPMLNEFGYIEDCLQGLAAQTHSRDALDVIVVDSGSTDGSRRVVDEWARRQPWVRVIENPKGSAAAAFNRGFEAAKGDVVCLMSSHGVPSPSYIEHSVRVLEETDAAGVGGRVDHCSPDPISAAIGLAMMSPFGMASQHRYSDKRQEVDTISHPAYWRTAVLDVGPFDETLARNSDYELNYRLRAAGRSLVFDPSVESVYRPRGSLLRLAQQFWWYGRWKARVIRRQPRSLRLRHLVAPCAAGGLLAVPVLIRYKSGRRAVMAGAISYGGLAALAVLRARPREHGASPAVVATAFPIMHLSWGFGFLRSLLQDAVSG